MPGNVRPFGEARRRSDGPPTRGQPAATSGSIWPYIRPPTRDQPAAASGSIWPYIRPPNTPRSMLCSHEPP